ncbi:MAG TPA: guanylate cyclase [Flavobacteriales bacterium]|nr:guanylate cyclase [Flavobacteriales bacterium]
MENDKDLIYENSALKKAKNELEGQILVLNRQIIDLKKEVDNYKNTLAKIPPELVDKEFRPDLQARSLRFKMATVLYIDIHGFKEIIAEEDSRDKLDQLDQILVEFDAITEKHKIQKIRTVGDSYMCAGGVPVKNITNPIDVVLAAMEMKDHIEKMRKKNGEVATWQFKMGIHTGPVTATVRGKKKISYDLTGEAVNISTRLASACEPGQIIISDMTHVLVQGYFVCKFHSKVPARYQGFLELYHVSRIKPAYSEDRKTGLYPSKIFNIRYLLRQFTDLQEVILDKLTKELPSYLYYHDVRHTIDVVNQAELIGIGEGVDDESILLLKTAALFHDLGHVIGYDNHEYFGTQIAREMLPKYKYSPEQIDLICEIIMATQMPPKPQTLLQKIICDSDLDYLGRRDFIGVSDTLYKELKEQNKIGSLNDWNKLQVKFLEVHQFYTATSQNLRAVNKKSQIERIKELIVED